MIDGAGICFFNHGTKCAIRLVVAAHSLRAHYGIPATVLDTGTEAAAPIMERIASDHRLLIDVKRITMKEYKKHTCYVRKASLWRDSPYRVTLLVDSDVLFLASPEPLIDAVGNPNNAGFLVTAFSDWVTTGMTIRKRIDLWHQFFPELQRLSLERAWPAINTGVVGWRRDEATDKILAEWEAVTITGQKLPWTDELAAQLIIRRWPHALAPECWNSSVLFTKDRAGAKIMHYHGSKNLRPEDGGRWLAAFVEARAKNIAGLPPLRQ